MTDHLLGKRIVPQVSTNEWCLFSFNNQILKYKYNEKTFAKLTYIPSSTTGFKGFIKEKILRNYIYRRFLTRDFGTTHISANDEFVIALYGGLYFHRLSDSYARAKRCHQFDEFNVAGPLFQGIAVHKESQHFYFGEYINKVKRVVRIIRISRDLNEISVVYEFNQHPVQHVHGVFYDGYLNRLWITTGDKNEECGIFYTDDEFRSVHKLGGGDQSWRAVSVIPMKDRLIWGSDAGKDARPEDINMIYSYFYETKQRTCEVSIGNPAYHSIVDNRGNIYLGVNFEPGRKQDTPEEAAIWIYNGAEWKIKYSFKYKMGNTRGCSRYGYVYFPKGCAPYGQIPYLVLNTELSSFSSFLLDHRDDQ